MIPYWSSRAATDGANCYLGTGDGLRRCRADPEATRDQKVIGCVDVAAQARPGTGQFDGARMAMALSRICAELRIQRDTEGDQRRGAGAVPISDEAARVGARGRDGLAQFLGLQCG